MTSFVARKMKAKPRTKGGIKLFEELYRGIVEMVEIVNPENKKG
jgi:hypothetical protein